MSEIKQIIGEAKLLHVQQVHEGWELIGIESRNKYKILDERSNPIAFAAEQSTGLTGTILRQVLGHWRSFNVTIFDQSKKPVYKMNFPFRWFFKTLYVSDTEGNEIGHLQQKFAIFRKKFDVHDVNGNVVAKINSSFFRFWTFEFFHNNRSLGKIQKKWSGALSEIFTDKDNFVVSYKPALSQEIKVLMLATCIMVDIIYFENNKTDVTDLFS